MHLLHKQKVGVQFPGVSLAYFHTSIFLSTLSKLCGVIEQNSVEYIIEQTSDFDRLPLKRGSDWSDYGYWPSEVMALLRTMDVRPVK